MRDLYNRKKKLDYWIERIHKDLDENDKKDVIKFLEIMQEKDQSILTITRCISIVIQIKKQIDKPLAKVTKEDKQKDNIDKDFDNYFQALDEYNDYIKKLIKNYNIKPTGNLQRLTFKIDSNYNNNNNNSKQPHCQI